jgi:hypothetical protein
MQLDWTGIGLIGTVATLFVLWLVSRHQHWNLRARILRAFLRKAGLLDESEVAVVDEVVENARRGESVKLYVLLGILIPAEIVLFIGGAAALAGAFTATISIAGAVVFFVVIVAAGYYLGMFSYVVRHVRHKVWCVTVNDPYTGKQIRADWSLAEAPHDLRFDDPVFQEVYRTIKGKRPIDDPLIQAMDKSKHRYLIRRTFVHDADDPWARLLLLTDCEVEQHYDDITRTTYVGIFPVRMTTETIGLSKVDVLPVPPPQVPDSLPEVGDAQLEDVLHDGTGLPVAIITDSKEIRRRILYGEALPTVDRTEIKAGEIAVQGLMNVEAAQKIRVLEKKTAAQDTALGMWAMSSGDEASLFAELEARTKAKPPEAAKPPRIPRKWLVRIAVGVLLAAALAAFLLVGLPLLINWWLVVHP